MSAATPTWLRPSVDYGPIAIFFAVYHLKDLMWATGAIMAATVAALAVGYWFERRLAPLPLVTAAIVGVFGALTLVLADETFIKMKPTIIKGLLAGVLLCGLAAGRQPLRFVFGQVWPLSDEGWRTLTLRFGLFFAAMAVLNEIVWRTQSTDFWVNFKFFGSIGLTLLFSACQAPLIRRHWRERSA